VFSDIEVIQLNCYLLLEYAGVSDAFTQTSWG
jgi:hypothetical protein